jgi:hypothetical protein
MLQVAIFTVVEWLPVFIDEAACRIVTDSLNFCIQKKCLGVNAYGIMPTHFHAIVFDVEFRSEQLKHTLDDMRKFTGRNCWIILPNIYRNLPLAVRHTTTSPTLPARVRPVLGFWKVNLFQSLPDAGWELLNANSPLP